MRGCRGCPPDKLAAFQSAYSNRLMNVWMIAIGLFPAVAGIRALMSGLDTWWLWLLAAAAQLASLLVRRNVGRKLGVVRVGRTRRRAVVSTGNRVSVWRAAGRGVRSAPRERLPGSGRHRPGGHGAGRVRGCWLGGRLVVQRPNARHGIGASAAIVIVISTLASRPHIAVASAARV